MNPADTCARAGQSAHRRAELMRRTGSVWQDLSASLRLHHLWRALATEDLVQSYRRASLGVGWILISFALMVLVFVLVFGRSSPARSEYEYTLYLATGLLAWTVLSGGVTKGVSVFAANGGWIKSTPAPYSVLVFKNLYNVLLETGIVSIFVVPMVVIYGIPSPELLGMLILAFLVYAINLIWTNLLLGSIGAWSSDFQQLVPALMRIAFFATPIFWDYEVGEGRRKLLATYNPFTHFVEIVRAPLMGEQASMTNWTVVLSVTLTGCIAAVFAFKIAKPRLSAWI